MAVDRTNFVTAVEMRDMLDKVIEKNPEALVMTLVGNLSEFVVLDALFDDLDADGDARFGLRSFATGKKVEIMEVSELDYQN